MAEHAFDPQSAAFREAGPEDWISDENLEQMFAEGLLVDTTDVAVTPVENYEAAEWDAGRHPAGPKSLEEARAALQARVDDPVAPDRDASLYDDLEPS